MELLFSKQSVQMYFKVWQSLRDGEVLTGLSEMMADAMRAHPEFDPFWPQGEPMFHPQEIDGYVVNPLVHTSLHVIIEKQLMDQDPPEAMLALNILLEKGISRHEAIHQLAGIWGNIYFRSVRRGELLEESSYFEELKAIIEG